MNKREKEVFKKKLLQTKDDIQNKLFGSNGNSFGLSQKESSGDLSGMPMHLADIGTDNYQRDFNIDIAQGQSDLLHLIDEAIEKLEDDTYGLCECCKEKIHIERLNVFPYVKLCIKCQEQEENKN